jgi:hypothetical protein
MDEINNNSKFSPMATFNYLTITSSDCNHIETQMNPVTVK